MATIWLTVAQFFASFCWDIHVSVLTFCYLLHSVVMAKDLKTSKSRSDTPQQTQQQVTYLFLQRPDCVVFTWFTMLLFLASFAFSAWKNTPKSLKLPSVLWHCWLSVREIIRTVKIEWSGVGVVICLERAADCLHMVQLMPLPSQNPSCLASFKSRLVIPFWYRLT